MKLSKLYFLPLFLILVFSLSACGQKNNPDSENSLSGKIDSLEDGEEDSYFSSSVVEMFKKEKPLQCSVEINDSYTEMKAVYYFDNKAKKVRVEMKTIDKEQGLEIHSVNIIKDDWSYFWDDVSNQDGMKFKLEDGEDDEVFDNLESEEDLVDMNEVFDFKCKSWKVDSSKFDLPKDKNFKDLSSLMNDFNQINPAILNEGGQSNSNSSFDMGEIDFCSYCDMVLDEVDKQECLNSCR